MVSASIRCKKYAQSMLIWVKVLSLHENYRNYMHNMLKLLVMMNINLKIVSAYFLHLIQYPMNFHNLIIY
jgi:hypothetical protein